MTWAHLKLSFLPFTISFNIGGGEMKIVVLTNSCSVFHHSPKVSLSSSSSSTTTILSSLSLLFSKMESSKSGGKRSVKDKMKEEVVGEEEEEEEDEDVVELESGEDNKMMKGSGRKGSSGGGSTQPRCQVDNCTTDMTYARPYHRRHKVCEFHAKVPVVVVAGLQQRFCQQCSRFHELSEFDETKKSCRRRLAGHNERRRKSSYETHGEGSG